MAGSGKRRGPGRQVLGVASLTAVASGTTALVIGMGSAQVSQQLLTAPYADGNAGGPLVVDQPRINVPRPGTTGPEAGQTGQTGTRRAVGVARPVGPVAAPARTSSPAAPAVRPIGVVPGAPAVRPIGVPGTPGVVDPAVPPVVDPGTDPGTGPGRPLPGQPGKPGIENPDDHGDDGPGTPGTPGTPGADEPDDPAVPGDGTICGIDGVGMQLPADVVRRLEEWLCGTTGRPVTVIAKPLRLVPPVRVPVTIEVPVLHTVHTPRHSARTKAAGSAKAKKYSAASAVRAAAAARPVAKPAGKAAKPAAGTRGHSHRQEAGTHEDRQTRTHHRGGRGHGRDDHRGHRGVQTGGATAVVRHADAGGSWLFYTGRHRVGR
ncbi:MAG: hypothetical protein JWN54_2717 [Mycobacterium sp.]|nr:hypothetical protein [Mycobacterium sp.]